MNGEVAQIVALTCHGNAFLDGRDVPRFFPENSTCKFCDSIRFIELRRGLFGRSRETTVATSPDDWIVSLKKRKAKGIKLLRQAQNDARISDRMSAGFVGGGGVWVMELVKNDGRSEYWAARREVWDRDAPEQRIWRVVYALLGEAVTQADSRRDLADVKRDFRDALFAIHHFSERENCGGFTNCFADALRALDDPDAEVGYYKDLALPEQLSVDAKSMLKASMRAWVFGGMGSWNDIGFGESTQIEYESVSDNLFKALNEAIEVSASSTAPLCG